MDCKGEHFPFAIHVELLIRSEFRAKYQTVDRVVFEAYDWIDTERRQIDLCQYQRKNQIMIHTKRLMIC